METQLSIGKKRAEEGSLQSLAIVDEKGKITEMLELKGQSQIQRDESVSSNGETGNMAYCVPELLGTSDCDMLPVPLQTHPLLLQ